MFEAAALRIVEEAGHGILILTEGLEKEELLGSRLTRHEVARLLRTLADTLAALPVATQMAMPELGIDGWRHTQAALDAGKATQDETLWFAVTSLVPATLMWLRVYRKDQPGLFEFSA